MAPKQAKPSPKSSRSKGKPDGKAPVKRATPTKQPASRPISGRAAGSSRKKAPESRPRRSAPVSTQISLDRQLDILGVGLTVAGLLITLSLASANRSPMLSSIVGFFFDGFGWGGYILPLAMIVLGLWLVLRKFERIPQVSLERMLGIGLLFTNLLALLHWSLLPANRGEALAFAEAGRGGGYIGATILSVLQAALGMGGAAIALLAWLLIGLAFTLDTSVPDLFRWAPGLIERLQDIWDELRTRRSTSQAHLSPPAYTGSPTPLVAQRAAGENPQIAVAPAPVSGYMPEGAQVRAWALPQVEQILEPGDEMAHDDEIDRHRARVIEETLSSFGAPAKVIEISRGPTITMFGVEPDFIESRNGRMRVRVSKIAALADDLALALSARTIRIQAPVPGKGYVGIEVPNDEISTVALRDVIESEAFKRLKSPLRFAIGQDVAGQAFAADLSAMPHLLIAGTTGSGKSVCVNSLIACLLLFNTPDDLRLIMVDPKRVELTGYNGIPHLLAPVVVEMERVVAALQWVLREMDQRYHKLAQAGCRNVKEYNARQVARNEKKIPYLVVIIDELADLMMLAPDETERTLTRLAQLARATGIHLVLATQRPSVDVVTGLIKANFPARIAFAVASNTDSRVILDQPGAERLLGRGDMLFQAPDAPAPVRLQGTFVSDSEIQRLVSYWQAFAGPPPAPTTAGGVVDAPASGLPLKQMPLWDEIEVERNSDPLFNEAVDLVRREGRASISMLQRRFRIGYTRAARLVESMEERGIVGPPEMSTGARQVLDYGPAAPPVEEQGD
jgi:S-DNA-T family DNA segregation ATPase FtsK/SpoIIIE